MCLQRERGLLTCLVCALSAALSDSLKCMPNNLHHCTRCPRKPAAAMQMGMLFVRDRGGISHSPLEYVAPEDIAAAAAALYMYLRKEMLL